MTWSEYAWAEIRPIYQSIVEMPFITELMDGTLALNKFQFYITQDAGYLEHFGRALALIGARAHNIQDTLAFIRFAENAIMVENALHESYFNEFGITNIGRLEPTCHHYTHFLKSTAALEAVEIGMAAVLPCFWIYKAVGDHIYNNQQAADNRYQNWINTYAGEAFAVAVREAIAICDRAASTAPPAIQQAMTEAFVTASRLEFEFWSSAYLIRKWEQ